MKFAINLTKLAVPIITLLTNLPIGINIWLYTNLETAEIIVNIPY